MAKRKSIFLCKEELELAYQQLKNLNAVGKKFGIRHRAIKRHFDFYKIEYYSKPKLSYHWDDNAFSKETEESFYWAGFIAADGCILDRSEKSKSLAINLGAQDKQLLVALNKFLKSDKPIWDKVGPAKNVNGEPILHVYLNISSLTICRDLQRFNIVPRKSLIYTFPEWLIDHPLKHHFIRGYNDGDGCFSIQKLKQGHEKTNQISFNLRGTVHFLQTVANIFSKECELPQKNVYIYNGCGSLRYLGNKIVSKIRDYLYKDATIYLPRKYEIALKAQPYVKFNLRKQGTML